ncbi:MAG TPA: hypothetical protein DDW50_09245 [Firmicutes bacterium]|jgi:lipopolysaccharide export system protein LptC|nr:hypothetical protein [Bacillota bacterium]
MNLIFRRILPFLIILGIAGMGYFGGWWDIASVISQPISSGRPRVPSINMMKTKLTGWDQDKKSWEIEARRIWQSADGNIVYFQKISRGVAFSMKNERVDFIAGWARWERIPEILYIGGGLEAKVSDCMVKTKEAEINYRNEVLTTSAGVQMTQQDTQVTAKSLEIRLAEEQMILEGDVVLVQNNNRVTANGMKFYHRDQTYQLIDPKGVTINP